MEIRAPEAKASPCLIVRDISNGTPFRLPTEGGIWMKVLHRDNIMVNLQTGKSTQYQPHWVCYPVKGYFQETE